MQIKNLLVTGEAIFLERHGVLFQSLESHFENISYLPRSLQWYEQSPSRQVLKGVLTGLTRSRSRANSIFQKNSLSFKLKSQRAGREIGQLQPQPDLIFQVFATYRPGWQPSTLPYAILLDYTTALAERNWSDWATFLNERSRNAWFECERDTFQQSAHLFSMSHLVKTSLVQDYGVSPERVTVVGSSGDFAKPYQGEKSFGSHQLLFNGSDFDRKGGSLLLEAFEQVRQLIPDATLVIVGRDLANLPSGVINPGHLSRPELHKLFLSSDLVVAPALCDPFPTFLMEAMNYGVPCVVANRDGMPEIVDHEVDGIVLEQLTPARIAQVIVDLLQNRDRLVQFSQAARTKMRTQLNWSIIAAHIAQVITDLSVVPSTQPVIRNHSWTLNPAQTKLS